MYATIGPEALGIRGLSLAEAIALARDAGFAGLAFDIRLAAQAVADQGAEAVLTQFAQAGVRPAHWSLPVAWRDDARQETVFLLTIPTLPGRDPVGKGVSHHPVRAEVTACILLYSPRVGARPLPATARTIPPSNSRELTDGLPLQGAGAHGRFVR